MEEIFNRPTLDSISGVYGWFMYLPVIIGLVFWKRLNNSQKLIFYISVLTVVNHVTSGYLARKSISNLWVFHFYIPILFYLTWKIYSRKLASLISLKWFKALLGISLIFFIANSTVFQGINSLPTYSIFTMSGVFILWSFAYFYSLLKQTQYGSLEREPMFWFNVGVLIYYATTVVIFLLVFNYLEPESDTMFIALIMNAFFNLILVATYTIALWVKPPK